MEMTPQAWPDWYDGRHINEVLFCQQFLDKHPMKCVRGRLFTVDGLIEDEGQIGNLILEEISGVLTSGLSKVVTNLLASISPFAVLRIIDFRLCQLHQMPYTPADHISVSL